MTPVRLEPAALQSQVKHSTTEPLHSHKDSFLGEIDKTNVLLFLFLFLNQTNEKEINPIFE